MRVRLAMLVLTVAALIGGASALAPHGAAWAGGSLNGVAGSMPAYYDHQLFTINFKPLTVSQSTLLAKNSQLNTIYMSDPGLPGGEMFISVLDAIQTEGFNPLWEEVQITFNAPHTPRQLFSDDQVAAAAASGEITLSHTGEVYRCSVIGKTIPTSSKLVGAPAMTGAGPTPVGSANAMTWGAIMRAYR